MARLEVTVSSLLASAGRQNDVPTGAVAEKGAGGLRILVASHGTEGARAAELVALAHLAPGGCLRQIVIVPEFWRSMSGDGWRINASTEHEFCDYLEGQIEREVRADVERLARLAEARGVAFAARSECGVLEDCLVAETERSTYDLVVMGSPRPAKQQGLRSRMRFDRLVTRLTVPVLVVPHPSRQARRRIE